MADIRQSSRRCFPQDTRPARLQPPTLNLCIRKSRRCDLSRESNATGDKQRIVASHVSLGCLYRSARAAGKCRHQAGTLARAPVAARVAVQDGNERRRLRYRLVWRPGSRRASTAKSRPPGRTRTCCRLCAQFSARTFFAHVRASTGASTARANCHPFSVGPWLFMHNGQIGGFCTVRRRIENMIPDGLYAHRRGGTDSEAIFLIAMGEWKTRARCRRCASRSPASTARCGSGPAGAVSLCRRHDRRQYPTVFRWSSDPTCAFGLLPQIRRALVVVSEPIDDHADGWQAVAPTTCCRSAAARPAALPVIAAFDTRAVARSRPSPAALELSAAPGPVNSRRSNRADPRRRFHAKPRRCSRVTDARHSRTSTVVVLEPLPVVVSHHRRSLAALCPVAAGHVRRPRDRGPVRL